MSQIEVDKIIPQSGTALQAGENGDTIKIRLRWKYDTLMLYLRNTTALTANHCNTVICTNEIIKRII